MMKAFIFTLLSMAAAFYAAGGTDSKKAETFLWPIEGKNAGEGIISKPQEYIGQELNIDDLFIEAEEGAVVVAPENGTLDSYFIGYNTSLSTGTSMRMETGDHSFDSMLKEARNEKYSYPVQYKYVTGTIGLKTEDGKTRNCKTTASHPFPDETPRTGRGWRPIPNSRSKKGSAFPGPRNVSKNRFAAHRATPDSCPLPE